MAKTKETIAIKHALNDMCRKKRIYGCEEVTIGFPNDGHGNEIVDFMSMDSKGILRCYEIKISLSDLHSNAKKSWYGNYNYLVVSSELYKKVKTWIDEIPNHIGISVYELSWNGMDIVNKRRPMVDKEQDMFCTFGLYVVPGFYDARFVLKYVLEDNQYHILQA